MFQNLFLMTYVEKVRNVVLYMILGQFSMKKKIKMLNCVSHNLVMSVFD